MKIVSIIVPVYNTGCFLYKCVNSILAQSLKDIEVIIIDDGSSSETAKICDKIAASDSRIRLVHKKNEGVSVARNTGLELATGKYVGFVDSDDWIDADMFEVLVQEIETYNADVVMCDATTIWDSGKKERDTFVCLSESCTLQKNEISPKYLLEVAGSSCRALYRTQQLKEFAVKFPVGLKFSEDRIFNMIALGISKRFRYVKRSFYNRYMRIGSCVMSYHSDFTEIALNANSIMKEVLYKYWDEKYIHVFEQRNLNSIGYNVIGIFNISNLSLKEKFYQVKLICENNQLQVLLSTKQKLAIVLKCIRKKSVSGIYFLYLIAKIKSIMKHLLIK